MVYSNFFNNIWYTPLSERESVKPSIFLIKPPSYKFYSQIGMYNTLPEGVIEESLDDSLLKHCVISSINVENFECPTELPVEVQKELIDAIISLFYPKEDFLEILNFTLTLSLDPKFSNESWSCSNCKAKGLDKQRNCPFLDKEEYHEDDFNIQIGEISYGICPMNKKDDRLLSLAIEAYKFFSSGFLPTSGGFGEQPLLFCILAMAVKDKIKYYEDKKLEEAKTATS